MYQAETIQYNPIKSEVTLFCHCGCIKLHVKPCGRKIQDDPVLTPSVDTYNDWVESHKILNDVIFTGYFTIVDD